MRKGLPDVPPEEAARIRAEIQKLRDRDPEAMERFNALPEDPELEKLREDCDRSNLLLPMR